ncbi:MAG: methyltransferase [Prevotella sp.]|nr:methyltransferase [Prevotella sp.]
MKTNDSFQFQQFTIHQEHCAMKVGTDGTLLGAWANGGRHILDIGTGTGLIALMMAQRFPEAMVTGIDIDEEAIAQALQNVKASPFASRISISHQNLTQTTGCFDCIVSNPPYFNDSLHCPDAKRTMARHTSSLTYRTLMEQAWQLLSDNGELSVVVPADSSNKMESEAFIAGFSMCRQCLIKTSERKPAKRILMAFAKHPRKLERTLLTLGSEECRQLTKDFYL